jgi:GT2 family glycosyltransferase
MRVSAVVPNKNGDGLVGRCVAAALAAGAAEVIVVDDGSSDESPLEAAAAGATVLQSPGRGFSAAVNQGARSATGEALLILNSDCFVEQGTIDRLAGALRASTRLGLCGAALAEPDGSHGRSHGHLLTLWLAIRTALSLLPASPPETGGVQPVEFVPLACALVRRDAWAAVGGLDERFFFYFEDHDLCRRLAADGWALAVCWDAPAAHVQGGSSRRQDEQRWFVQYTRSRSLYLRKHYPATWPLFAAVWIPVSLARAGGWAIRRRPDSRRWARAWLSAARAGISG